MAFEGLGQLGEYHYLVDKNGDIWSLDGKIYYGNKKNVPDLIPVKSSSVSGLGDLNLSVHSSVASGLGDLGITTYERLQRSPTAVKARQAAAAKRKAIVNNLENFYSQNKDAILASLPPSRSGNPWVRKSTIAENELTPGKLAYIDFAFLDTGAESYRPPKPAPPPHMQLKQGEPHPLFSTMSFTGNWTHTIPSPIGAGTETITEPITITLGYQTDWTAWPGFRTALKGWGLVEHVIAYALPAIAIVAAPFALAAIGLAPGAIAAGAATAGETAAVAAPIVTAGGGGVTAGGGFWASLAAALPSAETAGEIASATETAIGVGQKVLQSKSAQKQAKQQAAEAEQAAQQAQQVQAIQQEVQQAVDTGQPITQDLVNRAAALGIKISATDGKITTSAMVPSGKLPYVIGAGAFLIVMYFLFADRKRRH